MTMHMEHYDELAETYDDAYSKTFGDGYPIRFQKIADIIKTHRPKRVKTLVDIGGGNGTTTKYLQRYLNPGRTIISDFSPNMLDVAARNGFGTAICDMNDMETVKSLPKHLGGKVDMVFTHWCIHHCEDIPKFLDHLSQFALTDNGLVVVIAEPRSKFPGPTRVFEERNRVYEQNIRDLDRTPMGGKLQILHKEFFDTGRPWRIAPSVYEDITRKNFLTFLHSATGQEKEEYFREIRRQDSVFVPNTDFIYIFKKRDQEE